MPQDCLASQADACCIGLGWVGVGGGGGGQAAAVSSALVVTVWDATGLSGITVSSPGGLVAAVWNVKGWRLLGDSN